MERWVVEGRDQLQADDQLGSVQTERIEHEAELPDGANALQQVAALQGPAKDQEGPQKAEVEVQDQQDQRDQEAIEAEEPVMLIENSETAAPKSTAAIASKYDSLDSFLQQTISEFEHCT